MSCLLTFFLLIFRRHLVLCQAVLVFCQRITGWMVSHLIHLKRLESNSLQVQMNRRNLWNCCCLNATRQPLKGWTLRYHLPLILRRSRRLLKGSTACAILTARSNLTCTPCRWPPNIEDAHAIALQLYENTARKSKGLKITKLLQFYVCLVLSNQNCGREYITNIFWY